MGCFSNFFRALKHIRIGAKQARSIKNYRYLWDVSVSQQHLQRRLSSPTGRLNLGFLLKENLLLCSSYLPLGVPNGSLLREHHKRIYNFWCSMLVLHEFLYVLGALCGIIMHFLELTYWQDAAVPVPVFCCFCIPEKSPAPSGADLAITTSG